MPDKVQGRTALPPQRKIPPVQKLKTNFFNRHQYNVGNTPFYRQGSSMTNIIPPNDTEALLHERLQSLLTDLDTTGDNALYGHVLDEMDDYLFLHGRKFLTEILQAKTQERITAAKSSYQLAARQLKEFGCLAVSPQTGSGGLRRKMCFTRRNI
jgi:hypothetical protein